MKKNLINLFYENKSLAERFTEIAPINKKGGRLLEIKCIMRGYSWLAYK